MEKSKLKGRLQLMSESRYKWKYIPNTRRKEIVREIFVDAGRPLEVNEVVEALRRRGIVGVDRRSMAQWLRFHMEHRYLRKHRENGCFRWRLIN